MIRLFYISFYILFQCSCISKIESSFVIDNENFIGVDVKINNIPKSLIFDTCAEATVISKSLSDSLRLEGHRTIRINGREVDVVYIPLVEINGKQLKNVEAGVIDMDNDTFKHLVYDGIIGLNLINLFAWDFNLIAKKFSLHNKSQSILNENHLIIPFQKIDATGLPFIELDLGFYKSDSLFFDTGFTGLLSVNYLHDTASLKIIKQVENQKFVFGMESQNAELIEIRNFVLFEKEIEQAVILHNIYPKRSKDIIGVLSILNYDRFIFDPLSSVIIFADL